MKYQSLVVAAFSLSVLLFSCRNGDTKPATKTTETDTAKKETVAEEVPKTEPAEKPAIINIVDTISPKRIVVCFKDSAATMERVGTKLGVNYGKIGEILKKNNLKADGAPMAWYKSDKAPYFFEAGIPVTKKPAKLSGGAYIKEIAADSAVVAHFYGPYTLLSQGYTALNEWLKDAKKKSTAAPYEVYVGEPFDSTGNPIDPYKVRTDIIFPRK
jgi:effector-binding domain-containing protein